MKNLLKFSVAVSAVVALTSQVYATAVIYLTDGAGINVLQSSATGTVTAQTTNDGWSIVVATGIVSPPAAGIGTAAFPSMTLAISASYNGDGTLGTPLDFYFGSDGFGPSDENFTATLNGHLVVGTGLPITFSTWDVSGSALPTMANPIPVGANTLTGPVSVSASGGNYVNSSTGGPVNLASYSLGEHITLNGSGVAPGSTYSINGASLTAVPEPASASLIVLGIGSWAFVRKARARKG